MSDNMNQTAVKKKVSKFWTLFVPIYSVVILLIGAVGCYFLYQYMDAYEQSRPDNVMKELVASTSDNEWIDYMKNTGSVEFSLFDDRSDIINNYFEVSCQGKKVNFSEAVSVSTQDAPVYNIKAGSASMVRAYLEKDEELAFGFNSWKVARIEAYIPTQNMASLTIRIEAPHSTPLFINGVALDESYVINPDVPHATMSSLEERYAYVPTRTLYEVSGIYGGVVVTDQEGNELHPVSEADASGIVEYSLPSQVYGFKVTAPSDAMVFCNDIILNSSELVSTNAGILKNWTKYTNGSDDGRSIYEASGLYVRPEIKATAPNGRILEKTIAEDGTIVFDYTGSEELKEKYLDTVDHFFSMYINYGAGNEYAYDALLDCILEDTDLYTYVEDSTAAMIWASDTSVDFDYLTYTRFIQWSDNCFSCRVSYKANMYASAWYESYSYDLENTYDLIFIKDDGEWMAASMDIVD